MRELPQAFSVVTSVLALVVSLLGFYFTWWNEDPRLTVVTSAFDPRVDRSNVPTADVPFGAWTSLDMQIANPGNKSAAVLRVDWFILPPDAKKGPPAQRCRKQAATAELFAWQKNTRDQSGRLTVQKGEPLIVEPGKIAHLPVVFQTEIDWRQRDNVFDVESCFRFTVMDHLGRSSVKFLPAYRIVYKDEKGEARWEKEQKTYRVM